MANHNESLGTLFQALADPTRRAVIHRLGTGSASTKELAQPFDMALPSFMQHLTLLEDSGLITSKKIGRVRTWTIEPEKLDDIESWVTEQKALWEDRADRLTDYVEALYAKEKQMAENGNEFTISRLIKAPRHIVWTAWTDPQHLEKWWCPAPMTCKVLTFDARIGGAFDIMMQSPNGEETTQTGAFLDIIPQERIVFTTALTQEWRPSTTQLPITGIISMSDEGNGTRYKTRVLYKNNEEYQQLGDMGFEVGWSLAIDQLHEYVTHWVD